MSTSFSLPGIQLATHSLPIPAAAVGTLFDRYQNVYGQDPTGALA